MVATKNIIDFSDTLLRLRPASRFNVKDDRWPAPSKYAIWVDQRIRKAWQDFSLTVLGDISHAIEGDVDFALRPDLIAGKAMTASLKIHGVATDFPCHSLMLKADHLGATATIDIKQDRLIGSSEAASFSLDGTLRKFHSKLFSSEDDPALLLLIKNLDTALQQTVSNRKDALLAAKILRYRTAMSRLLSLLGKNSDIVIPTWLLRKMINGTGEAPRRAVSAQQKSDFGLRPVKDRLFYDKFFADHDGSSRMQVLHF